MTATQRLINNTIKNKYMYIVTYVTYVINCISEYSHKLLSYTVKTQMIL